MYVYTYVCIVSLNKLCPVFLEREWPVACFLSVSIVLALPGNSWIVGIAVGKSVNLHLKPYFMTDGHEEGKMMNVFKKLPYRSFRHKFIVRQIRKTLRRKVFKPQNRVYLECEVHNFCVTKAVCFLFLSKDFGQE